MQKFALRETERVQIPVLQLGDPLLKQPEQVWAVGHRTTNGRMARAAAAHPSDAAAKVRRIVNGELEWDGSTLDGLSVVSYPAKAGGWYVEADLPDLFQVGYGATREAAFDEVLQAVVAHRTQAGLPLPEVGSEGRLKRSAEKLVA